MQGRPTCGYRTAEDNSTLKSSFASLHRMTVSGDGLTWPDPNCYEIWSIGVLYILKNGLRSSWIASGIKYAGDMARYGVVEYRIFLKEIQPYIYTYMYTYEHTCKYIHTYLHTYAHTYTHISGSTGSTHLHTHAHIQTYAYYYILTHTYTCASTHTCTHAYTDTYACKLRNYAYLLSHQHLSSQLYT